MVNTTGLCRKVDSGVDRKTRHPTRLLVGWSWRRARRAGVPGGSHRTVNVLSGTGTTLSFLGQNSSGFALLVKGRWGPKFIGDPGRDVRVLRDMV